MFTRVLLLLLVFGGAIGGVGWLKWQQMEAQKGQQMAMPPSSVASTLVERETWQVVVDTVGSLVATQGIEVSAQVGGMVTAMHFQSGDGVEQGQLLLNLDDAVDRAALAALKAEQQLARIDFDRTRELLPKKAVSQADFDKAQANLQAAAARVAQQQAVIEQKQIKAPFSGLLGIRKVDPGQYLNPGEAIVSLHAFDPMLVDFSLPERDLSAVAVGMALEVRTHAYAEEAFSGHISAIATDIATGTRSIRLRGTLPNPDLRLRPGMFAEVRLIKPHSQSLLTVPRTAISYNTYGDFVYVIEDQEGELIAKRRQVETGQVRKGRVVILSGLEEGEQVVRTGLVKLREGAALTLDNSISLDDAEASR